MKRFVLILVLGLSLCANSSIFAGIFQNHSIVGKPMAVPALNESEDDESDSDDDGNNDSDTDSDDENEDADNPVE